MLTPVTLKLWVCHFITYASFINAVSSLRGSLWLDIIINLSILPQDIQIMQLTAETSNPTLKSCLRGQARAHKLQQNKHRFEWFAK